MSSIDTIIFLFGFTDFNKTPCNELNFLNGLSYISISDFLFVNLIEYSCDLFLLFLANKSKIAFFPEPGYPVRIIGVLE
jgi:hypothetical protein